jgi:hypothetical protein
MRRRITEDDDFKSYWAARKSLIKAKNKGLRLPWCKTRVYWPLEQYSGFLRSDESPYALRYKMKRRMLRRHNERCIQDCIATTVKHDAKINMWGCFCAYGIGYIALVDGILKTNQYLEIFENEMLPSAENLFSGGQ